MENKRFKDTAIEAAVRAGKYAKMNFGKAIKISFKGRINLVTEVDKKSEKLIVGLIKSRFPDHSVLSEEMGQKLTGSKYKWVIDPLDATTNYAHGFPFFCVSVALEEEGSVILGAVYDPMRDELFFAEKDKGAFLNNRRISVSKIKSLSRSLLATGFSYRVKQDRTNIRHFENFIAGSQAIRRAGSAALDLCYVACGRFDGFWEMGLFPWDTAASSLIAEEAGGLVSDFSGKDFNIYYDDILASNGIIHDQMIRVLKKGQKKQLYKKG